MKLIRTNNQLDWNPYWGKALVCDIPRPEDVSLFDQNGYDLTSLELDYAFENTKKRKVVDIRQRRAIATKWFADCETTNTGAHLNHAWLFERKGYSGKARQQLQEWAKHNNYLYKLLKIKPKWGIDISIDYVDSEENVFEVFHYEWDDFDFKNVEEKRRVVEEIILNYNWNDVAKEMLDKKEQWHHLGFFEQSKWKSDFIGLPPEQFKMVLWD